MQLAVERALTKRFKGMGGLFELGQAEDLARAVLAEIGQHRPPAAPVSYAPDPRVRAAINTAVVYGGMGGEPHKAWVIDRMVRELSGRSYAAALEAAKAVGNDWNKGVAP